VENIGGSFLAAIWTGSPGPVLAVYDAHTGTKVVQSAFAKDADFLHVPTVREAGSERTALGGAIFEPAQHNLSILADGYTPVALTPGHVFASDGNGLVADLRISGKTVTAVPFTSLNPTVPVGITAVVGRSLALVVVPNGDGWVMCALPSN
jgi:hypothetical protein